MDCKHIKREGESCPKNNNCRYPFCLADRNSNTAYCLKCGKTIGINSNSGLCLTCSIDTSTESIRTPPSSGEGSVGEKNINTNDLPSSNDSKQVLHKAHVSGQSVQFCSCSFVMVMRGEDDKPYCSQCKLPIDE